MKKLVFIMISLSILPSEIGSAKQSNDDECTTMTRYVVSYKTELEMAELLLKKTNNK